MDKELAIRELPEYSHAELPKTHTRMNKDEFVRRYGIFLIVAVVFTLYTILLSAMVARKTEKRVRAEMTVQFEQEMIAAENARKEAESAARFLSGEASLAAQMRTEATDIAKVLYAVRNNSKDDKITNVWCILNRVDNKAYPDSVEEVCKQPQQWMGYSEDNPVLDDLFQLAYSQLEIWHGGTRPVSDDFIYLAWSPSEITIRDSWEYSSKTHTWRAES